MPKRDGDWLKQHATEALGERVRVTKEHGGTMHEILVVSNGAGPLVCIDLQGEIRVHPRTTQHQEAALLSGILSTQ
jgi:hypothetical protein